MTTEQKDKIIKFRNEGLTYSDIANKLNLSINTVKSFYKRYKDNLKEVNSTICMCCGKQIVQKAKTRKKKFCSDTCRMKWWNSHRENVNKKAVYYFNCSCCGKQFQAYGNKHRKYCGRTCYIKDRFGGGNDER